ncbi:MAG: F0F1 ATP synthase subunit A [Stenotrophobium sp.]
MSAERLLISPSPVEYIQHHLHNLSVGQGLMSLNLDDIVLSWLLGGALVFLGWMVGRRLNPDTPGGVQNALESVVSFVNEQAQSLFPRADNLVGPLALTIFLWVIVMNAMDLVPVDLLPLGAQWVGMTFFGMSPHEVHFRAVPTAGLSTTFALSLSVFGLTIVYAIRSKGLFGYLKGYLVHPFGKWLAPVNVVMSLVEEIAKPLSLALRLFGNMFAGELVFMLVALVGFAWFMVPVQIALGWTWTVFETLIILIQAFIFMLLSVVYLAMASSEESH